MAAALVDAEIVPQLQEDTKQGLNCELGDSWFRPDYLNRTLPSGMRHGRFLRSPRAPEASCHELLE